MDFMSTGHPSYFNRYSYSANDPINNHDPNGQCWSPISGAAPACTDFARGAWEGATGSYTAWKLARGIQNGDPRSTFIGHGMSLGVQLAANNKGLAAEVAGQSISKNIPRFAGRVAGGSASSLAGGKGTGAVFKKVGAGKFTTKTAQASVTLTNFSSGQIASAATALGGLYDSASEAGYNPDSISVGALGNGAIISASGGSISFNAKSGEITAKLPTKTGSRISRTVSLGKLEKDQ